MTFKVGDKVRRTCDRQYDPIFGFHHMRPEWKKGYVFEVVSLAGLSVRAADGKYHKSANLELFTEPVKKGFGKFITEKGL